ncbi:MAG: trigger factor [Dehalococcoidia bacterium]|nr:MAG: trigger factor [Dehalococcoidia bacterium]
MKASTENSGNCQAVLTVEAEASELDRSLDEAYDHLVNKVSIPGFRKGKAPRAVLVQHIGRTNLLEEALEHLIPQLYKEAIESQGLEPIDRPEIEIIQTEPLVFKAMISLKPEVKLGDYHSIRLEPEPVPEIASEEITAAVEQLRERQGTWVPVDRSVETGDLITLDIEASVEGKRWLDRKGVIYEVDGDSRSPVPGFASHLQGIEKNTEKTFTLTIPHDYPVGEMRGKEGAFRVTVTEIKEKQLPELDDELARSIGHDDLDGMRQKVAADLRTRAEASNRSELRQKALDALVEISEVNYPPVLEDGEIVGLLRNEAQRLGFTEVADYVRRTGKTEEELREALRPIARKRLTQGLVLGKLAEGEGIEISSSEVDNRVDEIADEAEDKEKARQFFSLPQIRESIEQSLHTQRTMDRLLEIAVANADDTKKGE